VGLLDPVSPETGLRVSEEILMMLGQLTAVPLARASTSTLLNACDVREKGTAHSASGLRHTRARTVPRTRHRSVHIPTPILLRC